MATRYPARFNAYQPEKITELMMDIYPILTKREGYCLFLTALDLTKKEISQRMGVSENTVKTHIKSILSKQDMTSIREIKTSFLANLIVFCLFK